MHAASREVRFQLTNVPALNSALMALKRRCASRRKPDHPSAANG